MFFFREPAVPFIVWRNPAMLPRVRGMSNRTTHFTGGTYMVLERVGQGDTWVVVTVLEVLDGRPKVAA